MDEDVIRRIYTTLVCVICLSQRLRWIIQTMALIILVIILLAAPVGNMKQFMFSDWPPEQDCPI